MPFNSALPEWNKSATKPAQFKLDEGWQAEEKPPASIWNWFQNTTYAALQELQQNAIHSEQVGQSIEKKIHIGASAPADTSKLWIDTSANPSLLKRYNATSWIVIGISSLSWGNITGKPESFTPSAHKSTHATGGSDAIAPGDIGAEPEFSKGTAFNKNFGGSAGEVAPGNHTHDHFTSETNPHNVTKSQVGLPNVTNDQQATKVEHNSLQGEVTTHKAEFASYKNAQRSKNTAQDRELAYLQLKQDSVDRIEAPNTFADDFLGNRFGMVLDEVNSSNIILRDGGLIMAETTETTQTVTDATVTPNAYDTSGNGGRKLVRLDNGWLVSSTYSSNYVYLFVSKDDGASWLPLANTTYIQELNCLSAIGDTVYLVGNHSESKIRCFGINVTKVGNTELYNQRIDAQNGVDFYDVDPGNSALDSVTLTRNAEGTELHAAWSSKNSTYPNSFNIRYAKGTVNGDGSVTWGSVEQVTTYNSTNQHIVEPTLVIRNDGKVCIISRYDSGTARQRIDCHILSTDGSSVEQTKTIYSVETYAQSSPSAIFVPQNVNGLANGRIWVAWHGRDSGDSDDKIRVSYSDDGGATWSTTEKITSPNDRRRPSLTSDKNGATYLVCDGYNGTVSNIFKAKFDGGSWGSLVEFTDNTVSNALYASTLFDPTFQLDFSEPLFIYQDNENGKVGFYGTWTVGTETPTTTATAIYTLDDAQSLGAFVQREGIVEVEAYLNDELMDSELDSDEYRFEHDLSTITPLTLRLELSRADTTNGDQDRLTRILGGRG